jgi:diguanylate cyclase (GGDEF)-like protein
LLRTIGTRLVRALRAEDTVARMCGDEFAILVQSSHDYGSAVDARIRAMIERPVIIQGRALCPSCSIGVSLCPGDGLEFEALLEHADRSMYAQKLGHRPRRAVRRSADTAYGKLQPAEVPGAVCGNRGAGEHKA